MNLSDINLDRGSEKGKTNSAFSDLPAEPTTFCLINSIKFLLDVEMKDEQTSIWKA